MVWRACNKFSSHVFKSAAIFVSVVPLHFMNCTKQWPSSNVCAYHSFTILMIIISNVANQGVPCSKSLIIKP